MKTDEHIKKAEAIEAIVGFSMTEDERIMLCRRIEAIEAADVVSRMEYDSLKAERDRLLEEYRNMAHKVAALRRKIRDMKSDASWDEDIRRGQVQGMW